MKKFSLTILIIVVFVTMLCSQNLTQTVRGTIIDTDSKMPLIGAGVVITDSDPVRGTVTNVDGSFRLEKIPVGRITLQISYMGYETKTIPNIEVNSGKEVFLNIDLQKLLSLRLAHILEKILCLISVLIPFVNRWKDSFLLK